MMPDPNTSPLPPPPPDPTPPRLTLAAYEKWARPHFPAHKPTIEEEIADPKCFALQLSRAGMGLVGEAGELYEAIEPFHTPQTIEEMDGVPHRINNEIGDVLFYLAEIAGYTGTELGAYYAAAHATGRRMVEYNEGTTFRDVEWSFEQLGSAMRTEYRLALLLASTRASEALKKVAHGGVTLDSPTRNRKETYADVIRRECGVVLFLLAKIGRLYADVGVSLERAAEANQQKVNARYPSGKFTIYDAARITDP